MNITLIYLWNQTMIPKKGYINHTGTFDNLFGRFPGVNGAIETQASNPLEGDNDHTSPAAIAAIDGGKMDEFLPRGSVQYSQNELPNYYTYAHQ